MPAQRPAHRDARYPSLAGASVFVTGGGSGIGASVVAAFARQGASVAFADIDGDRSGELAARLAAEGHAIRFLPCDVTDGTALTAAIAEAAAAHGPVTVLINNAADDARQPAATVTADDWQRGLAINLSHQFFAAQAVIPMMRAAGGGVIVNMGSVAWRVATADMPVYHAAKGAIEALTKSIARDFGPDNIRCVCLVPGWTITEKQKALWLTPDDDAWLMASQCLKRHIEPEEIARVALFLASDQASACTGQSFIVDGGWVN